jgi:hypothetical protein
MPFHLVEEKSGCIILGLGDPEYNQYKMQPKPQRSVTKGSFHTSNDSVE